MENKIKIPKVLSYYSNADFVDRLKAKFVYYLILAAVVVMGFMIIMIGFLQISSSFHDGLYFPVLIPMMVALLIFVFCYLLLTRGYYMLSANMLLITSLAATWTIMFLSKNQGLARLDNVVWLFAILSMAPLVIDRKRRLGLLYSVVNAIILAVFLSTLKAELTISAYEFNDFLINTIASLLFMGIVSYNIYSINKAAIDQAQSDIKEREKSERALRESEARYKDLFDTMPNGFYRSTPEGYFIDANPAFVKMLGYDSLEELRKVYIPTDIYVCESEREEVTLNTEFVDQFVNFRLKRRDGQIIWLEENARYIKDENGKVLFHEGICRDVSDRKRAEDALLESEADLKAIIENAMESIWSLDRDYQIKYVNNAFAEEFKNAFGTKIEKGTNLLSALPDALQSVWKARYDRIFNNERLVFEDKVDTQNHEIFIEVSGNPIVIDDKVKGACFFGRNTTQKKLAEEELKQSKDLFETLFEAAPNDISLVDKNGKYILVNKPFADKLQLSPEDVVGKTPEEIGLVIEEHSVQTIASEINKNGVVKGLEIKSRYKDDRVSYSYYNGSIVTINQEVCLLSSSLEITEKKKIEKELENHKNHLERLVKERTEELVAANEELMAINEELSDKNEIISAQKEELEQTLKSLKELQLKLVQNEKMASLGILTAGVAHEINNPINFIANGTVAVENYITDEHKESLDELKPLFEAIKTGVKRVTGIVRSMSKYYRSESLPASRCRLHEIIDDSLALLYNQYKTHIKIVKQYAGQEPVVYANEGQLHQVFLNILANAVQSFEREGTIYVTTRIQDDKVGITITDNGTGIAADKIKHIFDPFYTTKAPGKGTGLGLSISQRIINDHNGTIHCESVLGKGSSFIIHLPLEK